MGTDEPPGSELQTPQRTLNEAVEILRHVRPEAENLRELIREFQGAASDLIRHANQSTSFREDYLPSVLQTLKDFWTHANKIPADVNDVFKRLRDDISGALKLTERKYPWKSVPQLRAGIISAVDAICEPWLKTQNCVKYPDDALGAFTQIARRTCAENRAATRSNAEASQLKDGTSGATTEIPLRSERDIADIRGLPETMAFSPDTMKSEWVQSHKDLWHELKIAKDKAGQRLPDRTNDIEKVFTVSDALRGLLIQLENIAFKKETLSDFCVQQVDDLHTAIWNNLESFDSLNDYHRGLFTWREAPVSWREFQGSNIVELIRDVSLTYCWILQNCSLRNTLAPSRQLRDVHPEPWFDQAGVTEAARLIREHISPNSTSHAQKNAAKPPKSRKMRAFIEPTTTTAVVDEFHDGTNVPTNVGFWVGCGSVMYGTWFHAHSNEGHPLWLAKFDVLLERFEQIRRAEKPASVHMEQRQTPHFNAKSFVEPQRFEHDAVSLNSLSLEFVAGYTGEFELDRPVVPDWAFLCPDGTPISNSAGDPFPGRFGMTRSTWKNSISDDLERLLAEAGNETRAIPGSIGKHLWKHWPLGFSFPEGVDAGEVWLNLVFELAWQQTSLMTYKAKKWTYSSPTSRIRLPSQPMFPRLPKALSEHFEDVSHLHRYPSVIYSEIPDIVSASISAIHAIKGLAQQQLIGSELKESTSKNSKPAMVDSVQNLGLENRVTSVQIATDAKPVVDATEKLSPGTLRTVRGDVVFEKELTEEDRPSSEWAKICGVTVRTFQNRMKYKDGTGETWRIVECSSQRYRIHLEDLRKKAPSLWHSKKSRDDFLKAKPD